MEECTFCQIVKGEGPASRVYEDQRVLVFLDIQPVNPGHSLVIPKRHAASLAELTAEEGGCMFQGAMRVAAALRRSGVKCEGIDLFLADGEAAGQEVFHTHLHVIPRFEGDGFDFIFPPHYGRRPPRAELDEIARKIGATIDRQNLDG